MVNQREAMDRLNKEKEYEDHLVEVLNTYILNCLEDLSDLNEEEQTRMQYIEGNVLDDYDFKSDITVAFNFL